MDYLSNDELETYHFKYKTVAEPLGTDMETNTDMLRRFCAYLMKENKKAFLC